ncbi:MAG TPA: Fe-S cluster assembly protein SufD [Kineosporiaceae bacterium]|nr:Fe-S cluster assembly protein SufD [Kineosporiaceae bacterium]
MAATTTGTAPVTPQGGRGGPQDQPGPRPHAHGAGTVPAASRAQRRASFDVADFPVPTGREEDWRFTPLDRLHDLHSGAAESGEAPQLDVHHGPGVTFELVGRDDERLGRAGMPEDRVAAQAWSSFAKAGVLTVGRDAEPGRPVQLAVTGRGGLAYAHLAVLVEREAAGLVVLDHTGSGTVAANVEIDVADGGSLTLVSVQDWDAAAVHLGAHQVRLGRDAKLRHVVVTLGGGLVRITPSVRFTGPGGDAELLGLYFADAGQHQEHRLFVDHSVPHCRSNVVYKGALQSEGAHTVWVGDVLIRAAAEATDTYELNRNLVLSDGARADSVPNLEIETGEIVGAGHASATGRFDDEQLFYLQARGIPEEQARRLVVRGFFAGVIQQIGVPEVADRLLAAIDARLGAAEGAADAATPLEGEVAEAVAESVAATGAGQPGVPA